MPKKKQEDPVKDQQIEQSADQPVEAQEPAQDPQEAADPVADLQQQLAEQKDLLLRTAAEYDNYKKRTTREKEELRHFTLCSLMKDLLPALDNFIRAADSDAASPDDYKKGMDMSIKQLLEILDKLGLKEIECEGKVFDPNYHFAVSRIEDETVDENIVTQVYQKGYQIGDTVIRPAMVVVANCN